MLSSGCVLALAASHVVAAELKDNAIVVEDNEKATLQSLAESVENQDIFSYDENSGTAECRSDITVLKGGKLQIGPGETLSLDRDAKLKNHGIFQAVGTKAARAEITSFNGSSTNGFRFYSSPSATLVMKHVRVSFCGKAHKVEERYYGDSKGVYVRSDNAVIEDSCFSDCAWSLIVCGKEPRVSRCVFERNEFGLFMYGTSGMKLIECTFNRNSRFGIICAARGYEIGNCLFSCNATALHISGGSGGRISGNTFTECRIGIGGGTGGIEIMDNEFIKTQPLQVLTGGGNIIKDIIAVGSEVVVRTRVLEIEDMDDAAIERSVQDHINAKKALEGMSFEPTRIMDCSVKIIIVPEYTDINAGNRVCFKVADASGEGVEEAEIMVYSKYDEAVAPEPLKTDSQGIARIFLCRYSERGNNGGIVSYLPYRVRARKGNLEGKATIKSGEIGNVVQVVLREGIGVTPW